MFVFFYIIVVAWKHARMILFTSGFGVGRGIGERMKKRQVNLFMCTLIMEQSLRDYVSFSSKVRLQRKFYNRDLRFRSFFRGTVSGADI